MKQFVPGKHVKNIKLKDGREVEFRYPKWEDLTVMTEYINTLSKEDTFITFSGEQLTLKEEADYFGSVFKDHEFGDMVKIHAFDGNVPVAVCDIHRDKSGKKRSHHIGILGITVKKEYRSQGLGEEIIRTTIDEAKKHIEGLKTIELHVYGPNEKAQNLYKKVGFTEYGRLPGGILYKDEYYDQIYMYLNV